MAGEDIEVYSSVADSPIPSRRLIACMLYIRKEKVFIPHFNVPVEEGIERNYMYKPTGSQKTDMEKAVSIVEKLVPAEQSDPAPVATPPAKKRASRAKKVDGQAQTIAPENAPAPPVNPPLEPVKAENTGKPGAETKPPVEPAE